MTEIDDLDNYEILTDENQQFDFTFKIIVIGNAGKN